VLQRRGALTVWLSDAALEAWRAPATGRPGGQRTYSDLAIEAALTIRMILGHGVRSRNLGNQQVKVDLACMILNTMTRMGMPDSCRAG